MNPIKSKLSLNYFLEKIEKLITDEQDTHKIQIRRTGSLISNLSEYLNIHSVVNDCFWGYGIEYLTNGIKKIEQSSNPQVGYLLTLFKIENNYLKLFFIRLTYSTGLVDELLRPLNLKLEFIERTTYSSDSTFGIYSDELDEGYIRLTRH